MEGIETPCGISPFQVVCTYAPLDGVCLYPSKNGPCAHGIKARETYRFEALCLGISPYSQHLHK